MTLDRLARALVLGAAVMLSSCGGGGGDEAMGTGTWDSSTWDNATWGP